MSTQTNESAALQAEFMAMVSTMTPDELARLSREVRALPGAINPDDLCGALESLADQVAAD